MIILYTDCEAGQILSDVLRMHTRSMSNVSTLIRTTKEEVEERTLPAIIQDALEVYTEFMFDPRQVHECVLVTNDLPPTEVLKEVKELLTTHQENYFSQTDIADTSSVTIDALSDSDFPISNILDILMEVTDVTPLYHLRALDYVFADKESPGFFKILM